MNEYITKEEAIRASWYAVELYRDEYDEIEKEINNTPAADVAPVVHGRWIKIKGVTPCCNVCGGCVEEKYDYPYCPNCGARMDEKDDTND